MTINLFRGLSTPVRNDLKQKFNSPSNMMLVDQSTNRSVRFYYYTYLYYYPQGRMLTPHRCIQKGQLTKQALAGPLPHPPARADHKAYLPVSNQAATHVAHNLDNVLKQV